MTGFLCRAQRNEWMGLREPVVAGNLARMAGNSSIFELYAVVLNIYFSV
jgi:hypothetical protein